MCEDSKKKEQIKEKVVANYVKSIFTPNKIIKKLLDREDT